MPKRIDAFYAANRAAVAASSGIGDHAASDYQTAR